MTRYDGEDHLSRLAASSGNSIFAVRGDLDGGRHEAEFQEREQFIGLLVGEEEFLMPIALVREINMLSPITYVPNAPRFIDGVINLRGNILPAVNLRKMMGLPRTKPTGACRVIVTRQDDISFGLLVDGITYVVALLQSEIEHQSLPGKGTGAELIGSISKQGNKICGILDIARILKTAAGAQLEAAAEAEDEEDAA